ncbi:uncharacterized protein [Ptychodera flava]|uniref:uncharacterized protein n=1 Tax=Ptychodera flava TaxID=63121 RepID=UPI00396A1A91
MIFALSNSVKMGPGNHFNSTFYRIQRVDACLGLVILLIAGNNSTLAVGIETSYGTNNDAENTTTCNEEAQHASVNISENANVGDIVFEDGNRKGIRRSFFLEEVNEEGTFRFDHQNGTIYLIRYLDFALRNIYNLLLSRKQVLNENTTVCLVYNITVIVNDEIGWPPYFNESCAWPVRKADRYPLPGTYFNDFLDYRDIFLNTDLTNFAALDLSNDQCDVTVYLHERSEFFKRYGFECSELGKVTCKKTNDHTNTKVRPFTNSTSYEYEDLQNTIVKDFTSNKHTRVCMFTIEYSSLVVAMASQFECLFPNGAVTTQLKPIGCPEGKYGGFCQSNCFCKNGATCHTFNGACKCQPGWKGVACDIVNPYVEMSPKMITTIYGGFYAFSCYAHQIRLTVASKNQSRFQWFINGASIDALGRGTYVKEDNKVYNSRGSLQVANASTDLTGKYECRVHDHSGIIYSAEGYFNISGCILNRWGDECENTCDCLHSDDCDQHVGCICSPGWKGRHCDKVSLLPKNLTEDEILIIFLSTCVAIAVIILLIGLLCYRRMKGNFRKYRRITNDQDEIHDIMREHVGQHDKWSIANNNLRKSQTLLGQGSSGQVHKGYFKPTGCKLVEEVAIKSLLPGRRNFKSYMDFASEISCLIKLYSHLNIVTLKGFALHRDDKCFVMESAVNGDLLNYLRCHGDKLTEEKAKELLCYTWHVTQGMQYMKSKQILHRDLSSRNILLFGDNVAKISDFGLSKDVSDTGGVHIEIPWSEEQTALPLRWMPPEFLTRGEFHFKSDVWSFGVLVWEVCAHGAVPFEDDDSYQFIRRIARGERLTKPHMCTDKVYQIMCKCWDRPLEMRPSAEQLTEELELLMEDQGLFTATFDDGHKREELIL